MAKRIRDFKRISMTAKTAEVILAVGQTTLDAHKRRCVNAEVPTGSCSHFKSGDIAAALRIRKGLKIGKKRATLDIKCPYSTDNPEHEIEILKRIATRIDLFSTNEKRQVREAMERVAQEILDYANRNAMQVLAEAAR